MKKDYNNKRILIFITMFKRDIEFLIKTKQYFKELGYECDGPILSLSDIRYKALFCLNHSETFDDAIYVGNMFSFILSNFNKIQKYIIKHYNFYKNCLVNKNTLLNLNKENDFGFVYLTNIFEKEGRTITISSTLFEDDELFSICYSKKKYHIYENEYNYYLRFSKLNFNELVLCDKYDNKLALIKMDDDTNLYLDKNNTKYYILNDESGYFIFEKNYISIFHEEDDFDVEKSKAVIEFDILEENSPYFISRLLIGEVEDKDIELMLLIALAPYLIVCGRRKLNNNLLLINSAYLLNKF